MNICDSRFNLLLTKVTLQHLTILPAFHTCLKVPPSSVPSSSAKEK